MPNHCQNLLKVSGSKNTVKEFKNKAKGKYPWSNENDNEEILSCNSFIPAPHEAIESYNDIGYRWCCNHWGTKWGCYQTELIQKKRSLHYWFDSAWSPPTPVIIEMSKQFPTLNFSHYYWEGAMGFQGHLRIRNGIILIDKQESYRGQRGG